MHDATNGFDTARGSLRLRDGSLEVIRITPKQARADAPTLVFLHEGLGSARLWRDFPQRLAEASGCPALLYSRFGYGGSDGIALPRPLDYMHREAMDVLPELLDRADVGEHVLIGHSDGASIALIYAACRAGTRLRGVISEAAHVFCEAVTVAAIERARDDYLHGGLARALAPHHGANTANAFHGWCDAWLDPGFRAWDIRPRLDVIRVPVLAIQGTDDAYGTRAQLDAMSQRIGDGAEILLLEHCGHTPHREQPQRTLDAMTRFLMRLST